MQCHFWAAVVGSLTRSAAAPFRESLTLVQGDIRLGKGLTYSWFGSVALCESVVLLTTCFWCRFKKSPSFSGFRGSSLGMALRPRTLHRGSNRCSAGALILTRLLIAIMSIKDAFRSEMLLCAQRSNFFFHCSVSVKATLEARLKDRLQTLVVRRIDGTRHATF